MVIPSEADSIRWLRNGLYIAYEMWMLISSLASKQRFNLE